MKYICYAVLSFLIILLGACNNEKDAENLIISDYTGSYKNIGFSEALIRDFSPGIYREADIPADLRQLSYGRIEIGFRYNGGALTSFMPLLYYGSINKNSEDDAVEETQFHLVVEIGHYNVIPFPVENLFYTICYDRYPLYCRDTYFPVVSGEDYTFVLDKRPEGIILQLKEGNNIVNSFPSAFFADSAQLFFGDVTKQVDKNRGDSLETILMIGKGFVGFARGLHEFKGQVTGMKVYKYTPGEAETGYEIMHVKNQHFANQQIGYSMRDNLHGEGNSIRIKYDFQPYSYESGVLVPDGAVRTSGWEITVNDQLLTRRIRTEDIGFYKVYLQTVDQYDQVVNSTIQPFEF